MMSAGTLIAVVIGILIFILAGGIISHALIATPIMADGSQQFDGGFTRSIMQVLDGGFHLMTDIIGVHIPG